MAVPWLSVLDLLIGVTDLVRGRGRRAGDAPSEEIAPAAGRALGRLESRLTHVVVAALKEAFERDARRLELEREQMEAERARAEQALRLELLRQAGEREIGRLRLVAGVAVASWLGTLFWSARLSGAAGARVGVGVGWALLFASVAAAFGGHSRVTAAIDRSDDRPPLAGTIGALAPWLMLAGLAVVGASVLAA